MDVNGTNKFKKIALWTSIAGGLPLFLMLFTLFVAVLFVLGLFDFDSNAGSSSGVVYESECNFENTMVTVMDGDNTKVLETVSLEDYIIGVVCPEIGACSGNVESIPAEYLKVKFVAARTYVLSRGGYNSSTKSITIRASTRDQQWCSLDSGCVVTKTNDLVPNYNDRYFYNTYPGNYTGEKDGPVTQSYSYTEKDLELLHQYYSETYGELYLSTSYDSVITSLNSSSLTSYKSTTQEFWKSQALAGMNYEAILDSTGSADVPDSSTYQNKFLYKLGNYCKIVTSSSSTNASIDYVKWMIEFAANNSHGYSMDMENRNMNPDVDCSSFVYYALLNNGYNKSQLGNSAFGTSSMDSILISIGFEQIPFDANSLQEGDILWYPKGFNNHEYGHTEVYVGDGKTVGAHSNWDHVPGDSSGDEVSIGPLTEYKSIFRKK